MIDYPAYPSGTAIPAQINAIAQAEAPQVDMIRRQQMLEAWRAYRGELPNPLKVAANKPNDNVKSNRCGPIVQKGVSFLFGQELRIEASGDSDGEETGMDDDAPTPQMQKLQDWVDGFWGDVDDRMTLLSQAAINGGVCGQVFFKLIPAQDEMQYPRIVVMDSTIVRVVTAPDDCSLTQAFVIEYPLNEDWQKKQVIARIDPDGLAGIAGEYDLDDTWLIVNYVRKGSSGTWVQLGEAEDWAYPFAPIIMCQNLPNPNEAWGMSDLTPDLIDMNQALNFIQSNTSRIIKFHGHPKTYATGLSATQINIGVDDLICLPSPDSKLNNLEMHGNLADQMTFAAQLRSDMDEQSRIPAVALGRLVDLPKGNISGVALQLLFQPLIEKTTQKQRLYGRAIRELTRAALIMSHKIALKAWNSFNVELHWQNLLPVDDLAAAQTALILKQIGVSDQTLMQQLGYNPDDEIDKNQSEDAQKLANFTRGQGMPPDASQNAVTTAQPPAAGAAAPVPTAQQSKG